MQLQQPQQAVPPEGGHRPITRVIADGFVPLEEPTKKRWVLSQTITFIEGKMEEARRGKRHVSPECRETLALAKRLQSGGKKFVEVTVTHQNGNFSCFTVNGTEIYLDNICLTD